MSNKSSLRLNRRYLIVAIIMLLALYVVVPQFGQFKTSLSLLSHPLPGWTALAVIFTFLTYVAGAGTYRLLAFKKIQYLRTLLVQFAAMFVNRLLPGGIGAVGANYVYLRRQKHTTAQAATVVAINNVLGGVGHYILLSLVLLITGYSTISDSAPANSLGDNLKYVWPGLIIALVVAVIIGWKRFKNVLLDIKKQFLDYRRRPFNLAGALLTSMFLTTFNVLALYACANALGVDLNLGITMLIFTLGIGAGTATPTPGGLGGFEAGLVAGFVSFHIDSSTALAIALLYRLISYWLTLLAGAVAFVFAEKRHYL